MFGRRATMQVRIPSPGEVWVNPHNWGACYITDHGMVAINEGSVSYPALLSDLGGIGNCMGGGDCPPLLYERDGWTVFDTYADFIEHRRQSMLSECEQIVRTVNEVCDREITKGSPLTRRVKGDV